MENYMQQKQTFGRWLRERRINQRLKVQDVAEQVSMDMGTISRIENERIQTTLGTVIDLCDVLEATPTELALALTGGKEPSKEQSASLTHGRSVLTLDDARAFLAYYRAQPTEARDLFTALSSSVSSNLDSKRERQGASHKQEFPYEGAEINKTFVTGLMFNYPPYHVSIDYPSTIQPAMISQIYEQGGLLLPKDIDIYINEKPSTLSKTKRSDYRFDSIVTRLRTDTLDRCKLADILWLDEEAGEEGQILGMFLNLVHVSHLDLGRYYLHKLIYPLVIISRWLQVLNWEDTSWLQMVRSQVDVFRSADKAFESTL